MNVVPICQSSDCQSSDCQGFSADITGVDLAEAVDRFVRIHPVEGLIVAAITDGNAFGISSGSPSNGPAVTGSVDLYNGLTSFKTLSYRCNGMESVI